MSAEKLQKIEGFHVREGPVALIIIDGFGVDKDGPGNAVTHADMP